MGMIIAIAYNGSKENVETILSENEIFLPVLMDSDGRITELYGVESVPVTFIINGDGTLHNAIPGVADKNLIVSLAEELS